MLGPRAGWVGLAQIASADARRVELWMCRASLSVSCIVYSLASARSLAYRRPSGRSRSAIEDLVQAQAGAVSLMKPMNSS